MKTKFIGASSVPSVVLLFAFGGICLAACGVAQGRTSATPLPSVATFTPPTPTPAAMAVVRVSNYQFAPASLRVTVGTQVTWMNDGPEIHTITSQSTGPLDSGPVNINDAYQYTFLEPGIYAYHCVLHPEMTGMITVTP